MPYTAVQEIANYQPYQTKINTHISGDDDRYTSNLKKLYQDLWERDFVDINSASRTRLNIKKSNQECKPVLKNNQRNILIKIGEEVCSLPSELSAIASEIKDSKKILDLQDDWDSEGALAVPQFVWERAAKTLISYSKWIWENKGVILVTPSIDALADGSIDIMWNGTKGRLLLNIRNSSSSEAHYYGDTYGGKNKFKGAIENLNEVQEFFAYWLTEFLK